MGPELKKYLQDHYRLPEGASDDTANRVMADRIADGSLSPDKMKELADADGSTVKAQVKQMITDAVNNAVGTTKSHNQGALNKIMAGENDTQNVQVRVKDPSERYCRQKSIGKHAMTGDPVNFNGSPVYKSSEMELAQIGAWFKAWARGNRQQLADAGVSLPVVSEHEQELVKEMQANGRWSGTTREGQEIVSKSFEELGIKTSEPLINDSTSGGEDLVPDSFDEAVITFPLLRGELLPLVDLKTTNRDVVDTASISNPTVTWNTSEGSSLTLFDASSMVSSISATVFPVAVAIEIGRDFMADSPVQVGATLVELFGQVFAKELDDVICDGDGTTQPEGIFQASSTGTVNSENGSTGDWTVGDLESLMAAVGKAYRTNRALNPVFLSNDTTYFRLRGIEVGTTDARRVLGMDHGSYRILGHPHKINAECGNAELAYGCLKKYRMWRRAGLDLMFTREGKSLTLANTALLVGRARYAGEVIDANAFAVCSDGMS